MSRCSANEVPQVVNYTEAGTRTEREVREALEGHGYLVIRSAASKGPADLVAVKGIVALVQVKRTASPLTPKERKALICIADAVGFGLGIPVLAVRLPGKRRIHWRMLTGPGPHDSVEWEPTPREQEVG